MPDGASDDAAVPTTAAGIVAATTAGEVTVEQVVEVVLRRICEQEPTLHAWAHLDPDVALAQALALDRGGAPPGPLHGVPVGVKDIIDTADQPTACGSPLHEGRRPDRDAPLVARLRAAGAVVVGKTVTTEFALFSPGPTVNPHDPARTPGGSSSGSAAAVAAGTVPVAVGTQTAGSVVRPAAFCGVFGLKPTVGAIPTTGVTAVSPTLDTVGAFATTAVDLGLAAGVMAGDGVRFEPIDLGERPRVGFVRTYEWDRLEPTTRQAIEAAVDRLARDLDVAEVDLPLEYAGLVDAQTTVMGVEAARELAAVRAAAPDLVSDQLRRYLDAGAGLADRYDDALALAGRCRELLPQAFAAADVLLAPAVLGEAPPVDSTGDPLPCRMWTLLGTPAVAVPGLLGPAGLPLGVQVVTRPGRDGLALAAAERIAPLLAENRAART